jgi:biopolymer transport protein ExbB
MEFFDTLAKGGPLIPVIVGASILGLTVFIERLWATRAVRVFPQQAARSIMELIREGRIDAALSISDKTPSPLASMVTAGLRASGGDRAGVKERMEEAGLMEVGYLRRFISLLATISTVAPLLGLLGTVTGMVQVFQAVESSVEPQIGDLAGGIWEALLTTVAGLSVAIPAFLGHRFLESRIDRVAMHLEEFGLDMLEALFPTGVAVKGEVTE